VQGMPTTSQLLVFSNCGKQKPQRCLPLCETRWHIQFHGITKYSTKIDHKTRKTNKENKTKASKQVKGSKNQKKKQIMPRRSFLVSTMIRNEKHNNLASKKPNG